MKLSGLLLLGRAGHSGWSRPGHGDRRPGARLGRQVPGHLEGNPQRDQEGVRGLLEVHWPRGPAGLGNPHPRTTVRPSAGHWSPTRTGRWCGRPSPTVGHLGMSNLLALYPGLRRAEIASLRWAQFERDGWVRIVGKGSVEEDLPVHPKLAIALERYAGRRISPYLFPGRDHGHVRPQTVYGWVRRIADAAGVETFSPISFDTHAWRRPTTPRRRISGARSSSLATPRPRRQRFIPA